MKSLTQRCFGPCSVLLCCLWLVPGCMPERRSEGTDSADSPADEDAGGKDAAAVEGSDAGPATSDGGNSSAEIKGISGCKVDKDCSKFGKNPCYEASCDTSTGKCAVTMKPDDTVCGKDGNCRTDHKCIAGFCSWKDVDCDDGNPCSGDSCVAELGCSHPDLVDVPCDDGNPCTEKDKCAGGACAGSKFFPGTGCPDDGNACTQNACSPEKGCYTDFIELATGATKDCDDGDKCTTPDICKLGKCVAGGPKKCVSANALCGLAACHPTLGCVDGALPGLACTLTGLPCKINTSCQIKTKEDNGGQEPDVNDVNAYICKGEDKDCDDDNPCTDDVCVTAEDGACSNKAKGDGDACDDGDPCSASGTCKGGKCGAAQAKDCDDGNTCTADSCDGAKGGCAHVADDQAPCDDGNQCTGGDACSGGLCKPVDDGKCDDGNPCTDDVCGAAGCSNGLVKLAGACAEGKCWWGQCLAPKCGNNACEPGEDNSGCAGDCPAEGGACAAGDAACIGSCQGARCAGPDGACGAEAGCVALKGCLAGCSDAACRSGCLSQASAKSASLFQILESCRQAACIKNDWSGQLCGLGAAQAGCISTCSAAACWTLEVPCQANADCTGLESCIGKCVADVACEKKCAEGVPAQAVSMQTALDNCRKKLCL